MNLKEAKAKNKCPNCAGKSTDAGYIDCNLAYGKRCGICEQFEREGFQPKNEKPFYDHICDDCCGHGTFDAYKIYSGRSF